MKIISQNTNVPILADEAVFTLEDVKKVYENGCADMINIKMMKCGGITKAREILEYVKEKNIGCMLGSMLESPISLKTSENSNSITNSSISLHLLEHFIGYFILNFKIFKMPGC